MNNWKSSAWLRKSKHIRVHVSDLKNLCSLFYHLFFWIGGWGRDVNFLFDLNLFFLPVPLPWKWGQKNKLKLALLVKYFPMLKVCFHSLCINYWIYHIFNFPSLHFFFLRNLAQFRNYMVIFFVLRGILLYKFIIVAPSAAEEALLTMISICDKLVLSWSNLFFRSKGCVSVCTNLCVTSNEEEASFHNQCFPLSFFLLTQEVSAAIIR